MFQGIRQGRLKTGVIHVLGIEMVPLTAVAAEDRKPVAIRQVDPVTLVEPKLRLPFRVVLNFDADSHVLKN